MCGIVGVVSSGKQVSRDRFTAMRDALQHRGPDNAGLWEGPGAMLGHRRLAVIDPTPAGHQPMSTPDGRYVLVYNGELYNDDAVRKTLGDVEFTSSCDTETVLHAAARWGADAGHAMRGMFALALWDTQEKCLLLGRDPLGIKPLYWTIASGSVVFASEIPAILMHPAVSAQPDWSVVSSYLTTIRATLGERTLYAGIRCVEPGGWVRFDLDGDGFRVEKTECGIGDHKPGFGGIDAVDTGGDVGQVVEQSICAHLRSDVPWCCLLSGGLDSTIVSTVASEHAGPLRTYVSGCPGAGEGLADDFTFAREAAAAIGSHHHEVPVERAGFIEQWQHMVDRLGVPLCTPNEVAIYEVARALRHEGHVVVLSGEGADELFGGYDLPLRAAAEHIASSPDDTETDAAFVLGASAWMPVQQKNVFLSPGFWAHAGRDDVLRGEYERVYRGHLESTPFDDPSERRMQAMLRVQRSINLVGLLRRLDSSTMLASVEGRTPLADQEVAALAESLFMSSKFVPGDPPKTKIALREAFRGRVPESIASRPKRSFPLPFQHWLGDLADTVRSSAFLAEIYSPAAVEFAYADPVSAWNIAWPMANLALWGRRWG